MSIDLDLLSQELKRDEGFRDQVYLCSAGKQTLGYGINLESEKIPERIASLWLDDKMIWTIGQCEKFDWFYDLSDVRKRVILNMSYQMGITGVSKFKNMIRFIEEGDFRKASDEMRDSKWFRQTPNRAERLAQMMHHNRV